MNAKHAATLCCLLLVLVLHADRTSAANVNRNASRQTLSCHSAEDGCARPSAGPSPK
ncbi:hypothetical protein ACP4OV_029031 [Aristida adscensionis]